jgi:uncharacterized phage protein gp47/JayE
MTIPTIVEIRDQILTDIQSGLSLDAAPLPRSTFGIIATAIAGALAVVYRFAAWVEKQIFTQTADSAALVLRANEYGLTRTPATKWIGTITATGTDGTVIASGTLWTKDSGVYQTTASATISGSTAVSVESLTTGDAISLDVADVVTLVSPQAGVDRSATVATVTQAGEDQETLSNFRARILSRQQNVPQGGAIPDWIGWTIEVPGISECKVDRPAAGSITVYPLTDDADPANRIPGGAKLTEVETYISDPERAPIRAGSITVTAPTEISFDVDISDLSPNDATTKANIEAAIEAHLYSRRPKQYSDEPDPRDVVSAARLSGIAVSAGAEVATVDLKNAGGTSITDATLAINELAVLRTLTWI